MLTYSNFKKYVSGNILSYLPETFPYVEVVIAPVIEGGVKVDVMYLETVNSVHCAVLPLNNLYEEYTIFGDINEAMIKIAGFFLDVEPTGDNEENDEENLLKINKDYILTNVSCYIVSKEFHEKNMKGANYITFHDMVVVFDIPLSENEKHRKAALITDSVMKSYDLTLNEVHEAAIRNTKVKNQYRLVSLKDAAMEELKEKGVSETVATALMSKTKYDYNYYIFKGNYQFGSANAILYNDVLRSSAEIIGGNYYILPHGGDDVIIIKEEPKIKLDEMIKISENMKYSSCVKKPLLSESVYYYDREKNALSVKHQATGR